MRSEHLQDKQYIPRSNQVHVVKRGVPRPAELDRIVGCMVGLLVVKLTKTEEEKNTQAV